jgi:hypothetical protein
MDMRSIVSQINVLVVAHPDIIGTEIEHEPMPGRPPTSPGRAVRSRFDDEETY